MIYGLIGNILLFACIAVYYKRKVSSLEDENFMLEYEFDYMSKVYDNRLESYMEKVDELQRLNEILVKTIHLYEEENFDFRKFHAYCNDAVFYDFINDTIVSTKGLYRIGTLDE